MRRACHAIVDEALAEPDSWRGFCPMIEGVFELHERSRGFTDALALLESIDCATGCAHVLDAMARLARRAKEAGRLRPDFVLDDLVLMYRADQGLQEASMTARVAASRRFTAFVIQAFGTSPAPVSLPPVPLLVLAEGRCRTEARAARSTPALAGTSPHSVALGSR